ncbi:glycosyltransferase family 4 protein [Rhodovulum sulfidophilum]|uniref:Glycosyltransferase family 4 protein n=1 Tax=Rhodovulum sulfidophilum TaxID=35806 RepID=A0ABS1RWA1_RHOSU|nr:glycosyltransferase family 4 protein [Rhodovulum sulfidophilum]MBL3610316.1 glycosyltransferase family 4 protein [Rhodovulum sulfidophilum]MCE8458971.1 glycosyltransferase family 4 protein [Rhodovulum sulfidophilum]
MDILMIMNGLGIGGAELQFLELARCLARRHRVRLICLQGDAALGHGAQSGGIDTLRFCYRGRVRVRAAGQLAAAVRTARRLPADVVLTTSFIGNAVGLAAAAGTGRRLVSLQTVSACKRYRRADRAILRRFDLLIAGCEDIRQFLLSHGQDPQRLRTVNNWVDFSARRQTASAAATRARFGLPETGALVGCIGRMHVQKGQEFLIRAFRSLSAAETGATLVLVGDGPRMDEMRQEAAGDPRIVFTGTIGGDDYTNLLAAFDIYVQPSRFEGLPRTLLDAMYLGRPVIATGVNGNRDAIRDGGNGLLVPPCEPAALAAALGRMLDDPALAARLGARAAEDARSGFAMETQTARIEEILCAR